MLTHQTAVLVALLNMNPPGMSRADYVSMQDEGKKTALALAVAKADAA